MEILYTGEEMVIKGDETLLAKIKGKSLDDIDISGIRVNADELAKLFDAARAEGSVESIGRYALLKEKYLAAYNA
ncbi:hypothetical protein [Domibacillus sp.]|uniref:hypothetical protein n=1 Tax=Domibacillus sp. TaxID=1969783 RepID=UPI0028110859|nr:hypothetical protein [Domibacillus sp.]